VTWSRRAGLALGLLAFALTAHARVAFAHDLNTASLSLTETEPGHFRVRWQASSFTLQSQVTTPALFPSSCRLQATSLDCGRSGLVGTIEFPWLEGAETSLVVDIEWRTGMRLLRVISGSEPRLVVYGIPPSAGLRALGPIVVDYIKLGVEHILTGFDHLLFVLALTLLVQGRRRLVASITAFTAAHSITLACAVLGLVHLPASPVEACIALSIVLVCSECLRANDSLARRAPWLVAFAFGLLHGLGFASALLAIGLPEQHLPTALLFFNVGVELGQLGVIAVVFSLRFLLLRFRPGPGLRRGLIYAMGTTAAFWSIDRIIRVVAVFAG
jgi:hydrogenase/urease accessory protein HupE